MRARESSLTQLHSSLKSEQNLSLPRSRVLPIHIVYSYITTFLHAIVRTNEMTGTTATLSAVARTASSRVPTTDDVRVLRVRGYEFTHSTFVACAYRCIYVRVYVRVTSNVVERVARTRRPLDTTRSYA